MTDFALKVYEFLRTIPDGKVVTYGQLARAIGSPKSARAVGNALHVNPDSIKYPCYKVVNGKGELAKHFGLGIEVQKERLIKNGIEVNDYKVDLKKYQWNPTL